MILQMTDSLGEKPSQSQFENGARKKYKSFGLNPRFNS